MIYKVVYLFLTVISIYYYLSTSTSKNNHKTTYLHVHTIKSENLIYIKPTPQYSIKPSNKIKKI